MNWDLMANIVVIGIILHWWFLVLGIIWNGASKVRMEKDYELRLKLIQEVMSSAKASDSIFDSIIKGGKFNV